ncbi:MAG TPA: DUF4389 domain-containing protein [Dehalococcoidales bacterium]
MSNGIVDYPIKLSIDYPDHKVNRLTSFFRLFTVLPIGFVAALFVSGLPSGSSYTTYSTSSQDVNNFFARYFASGAEAPDLFALIVAAAFLAPIVLFIMGFIANLFNPIVLMLVFRQKYPKWWFDYYVMLLKFFSRIFIYLTLLTDVYPSTDEEQNVHIEIPYPDVKKDMSQGLPLIKWFLAIPHYIVLAFVAIAAIVCDIIIWFTILFTGRIPKGLFDFIAGFYRWFVRVLAYACFQFTDTYPPFSLD